VQFHGRLDPELRLAFGMLHMHMRLTPNAENALEAMEKGRDERRHK
jgi:hypothetical protein